jgi:hypothetical protein
MHKKKIIKKTGDSLPKKPKKAKKVILKPFNSGTMTISGFWGFIRSALRQKSRWWKPIQEAKLKARRTSQSKNKRQKYEYQCAHCKKWFAEKEIAVDHINEAGTLRDYSDLPQFVKNLFCEANDLQVLCKKKCHHTKTQEYRKRLKLEKQNGNI